MSRRERPNFGVWLWSQLVWLLGKFWSILRLAPEAAENSSRGLSEDASVISSMLESRRRRGGRRAVRSSNSTQADEDRLKAS